MRKKMAKQLSDDEQNLRRKARRRLIGAFALTLVVVVILPMVLDSEPKPTGQDIDLRIPDADEVGEFVPKTAAPGVAVVLPSSGTPAAPAASTGTAAAVKEQPASNQKVQTKNSEKAAVVTEGFVAQVGAYSNADTAKQELDKLKKWGFKAYTEKAAGMVRVRVGPYPDREKAEKVRLLLEKHGLHPVVLNAKGS
ncbi:MAG: SPOR domain-containing protein [Pseudomonadota bacterium]